MTELWREAACFPHARDDSATRATRALEPVADDAPHVDRKLTVVRAHPDRDDANVMPHLTLDSRRPPEAA